MGKSKIIYITGGQRSGKSEYAEKMAERLSSNPVYLATAGIFDSEMGKRVEAHRRRRGNHWHTVEAQLHCDVDLTGKTVLLDCLTMLATNHFFENGEDVEKSVESTVGELRQLFSHQDATLIIVSNEIGLGGVSPNEMQRKFTDLQGKVNQYVAREADEAYLIVSGLPLKLK